MQNPQTGLVVLEWLRRHHRTKLINTSLQENLPHLICLVFLFLFTSSVGSLSRDSKLTQLAKTMSPDLVS